MSLKSAFVETICRNGRFFLPIGVLSKAARCTSFPLRQGLLTRRETRSSTTLNRSLCTFQPQTRNVMNWSSSVSDLPSCFSQRGHFEQFVRTSSTQASPATEASESEKPKTSTIKTQVVFEEVESLVASGKVTLVDVREPDELQQSGSLPGCINIPLTKLKAALSMSDEEFVAAYQVQKLQKDDPNVIFYGLSSVKSSAAVEIAHKLGFKKSRHYPGGMEEWSQKFQKSCN